MKKEIRIPEIAENVETAVVSGILVSKGEEVNVDQSLVEIETDKATTDLPSPVAGIVDEIKVKEGEEVKVDQVIMIIQTETDEKSAEKVDKSDNKKKMEDQSGEITEPEEQEKNENKKEHKTDKEREETDETDKKELSDIPAAPSVRRLARELEVDLRKVEGTGPGSRITSGDVERSARKNRAQDEKQPADLPDFSHWGHTSSKPLTTIREITARNVSQSWSAIPHVTQFDEADITLIEKFRNNFATEVEKSGGKLTLTAILLKIAGFALQKFPRFNSSIDTKNNEIVYKHYYNIGVAADTPQGLLVPVVNDVNTKSLQELSVEIGELAQKARDKKLSPEEMQGGNFTISNLGSIGGTAFTPIILPPQVAILGLSRASYKPVYNEEDDQPEKRLILPLSLSYDHRVIDGADGVRFLRWICDVLEEPYALLK